MLYEKNIFGLTEEQLQKQLRTRKHEVDPEYNQKPINPGEALELAIRGFIKIFEDPKLRARMRRIYRGFHK